MAMGTAVIGLQAQSEAVVNTPEPEPSWLIPTWGASGIVDDDQRYFGGFELRSKLEWFRLHPAVVALRSGRGSLLIGVGLVFNHDFTDRLRLTLGLIPSYYDRNEGPDLGRELEFLSFGEISWKLDYGHRVNLRLGHISNAGLAEINPGTELLTIGYAIPL